MDSFNFKLSAESIESIALRVVQLQKEIKPEPNQNQTAGTEEPISIADACALLRISRVTLNNWRKRGIIKAHGKGRKVYLFKSELLESLKQPKKWGRR
jgi:hypothetical protein